MKKNPIAIIEDDKEVQITMSDLILGHLNVESDHYDSVDSFLKCIDENSHEHLKLIISDIYMPTGSGLRINKEMYDRDIDIPILYVSGMIDSIPKRKNTKILRKPINVDEFITHVREVI